MPTVCWRIWTNWTGRRASRRCSATGSVDRRERRSLSLVDGSREPLTVFTTRPDTIFGATYMVLVAGASAGVHHHNAGPAWGSRCLSARSRALSEVEKLQERAKTGVFTGAYAINPATGAQIPIWIADYVLMGYGTGAIMAVPAHDERDHAFAQAFGLPIVECHRQLRRGRYPDSSPGKATAGSSIPASWTVSRRRTRRRLSIAWLEERGVGQRPHAIQTARLAVLAPALLGRAVPDPAPIGRRHRAAAGGCLPLLAPGAGRLQADGGRRSAAGTGEGLGAHERSGDRPASAARDQHDAAMGRLVLVLSALCRSRQRTAPIDPEKEKYWMPVDLYVGGAEHAVLHLLYARFWHKVLYDIGLVSTKEPFQKLFNQGMILAFSYGTVGKYYRPDEVDRTRRPVVCRRQAGEPASREDVEVEVQRRQSRRGDRQLRRRRHASLRDVHGAARCRQALANVRRGRCQPFPSPRLANCRRDEDGLSERVCEIEPPAEIARLHAQDHPLGRRGYRGDAVQHGDLQAHGDVERLDCAGANAAFRRGGLSCCCSLPSRRTSAEELWSMLGHQTSLAYEPWPDLRSGIGGG